MTFGQSSDENSELIQVKNPMESIHVIKKGKTRDRKHNCNYCGETFRRKDALDRHVYHHTNEVRFNFHVYVHN